MTKESGTGYMYRIEYKTDTGSWGKTGYWVPVADADTTRKALAVARKQMERSADEEMAGQKLRAVRE